MNKPIHDTQINKVLLQPRFKFEVEQNKEEVLITLSNILNDKSCEFRSKIAGFHVVIDVPKEEEHYWSPQMHVEIIDENDKTMVKGLLSPKPKVWTFFMFLHFLVAIAFFVFLVMFYTQYILKQDFKFSMIMFIAMPIAWIVLYLIGQFGKKLGYNQMVELHDLLVSSLKE